MTRLLLWIFFSALFSMGFTQEPVLTFRFSNYNLTGDGSDSVQFDVDVKCSNSDTYHLDLQVYVNYNPQAFGQNLISNNKLRFERLDLLNKQIYGVNKYSIAGVNDNTGSRFAIATESNFPGIEPATNPEFFTEVTQTFSGLFRFTLPVTDTNELAGISFEGLLMNGGQYYQGSNPPGPVAYQNPSGYANDYLYFLLKPISISIPLGWSGISSYIEPVDDNIETIFSEIADQLVILQNQSGFYWPGQNINTLGIWNMESGYSIKVAEDVTLSLSGSRLENQSLALEQNWNLIPVLSECDVDVVELFEGSGLLMAKEVAGWRIYWPEFGINTLQVLEPGKAYFVLMQGEDEIAFPECDGALKNLSGFQNLTGLPNMIRYKTALTHTIAIPAEMLQENIFEPGSIIAAYDSENNCYGAVENSDVNTSLTLFGDDPTTTEKDGFVEGEEFNLKLIDAKTGQVQSLEVAFDENLPNSEPRFQNNGLSAMVTLKIGSAGMEDYSIATVQIIPNPARDEFVLKLNQEQIESGKLTITSLDGRPMGEFTLEGAETKIDISNFSKGVYLLVITVDDTRFIRRLIKH